MKYLIVIILAFGLHAAAQWTGILPQSRTAPWAYSGVLGGIPSDGWSQCTNAQCQAVTSAGAAATASQIQTALSNAPANTYVQLAAGTYTMTTGICVTGANNVELRGAGANQTVLNFTGAASCANGAANPSFIGFQSSDGTYPGQSGLVSYGINPPIQGASTITVLSGSITTSNGVAPNVVAGQTLAFIDQCISGYSGLPCSGTANDNGNWFDCNAQFISPSGPGCAYNGSDGGRPNRDTLEIVGISAVSCSGSTCTVTLDSPIVHPNWSAGNTPQVWFVQGSHNVGFRDFRVDGAGDPSSHVGPNFYNVENGWAQGLAVTNVNYLGIWMLQVSHISVVDNYIYNIGMHTTCSGGNCDPWGIKDNEGTYDLFQNNIVQDVRVCAANGDGPATGDVTAYNFCVYNEDGGEQVWQSFVQHSGGDDLDLYEGNIGPQYDLDQVHGSHLGNVAFRNFFEGWESCSQANCGGGTKNQVTNGILDLNFDRYNSFVANVVGPYPPNTPTQYQILNASGYYNFSLTPYVMGAGNQGSTPTMPADPIASQTAMRWGNYDFFNSAALYCTGSGSGTPAAKCIEDERGIDTSQYAGMTTPSSSFPASFYLSSQPSWWTSGIPFPPIGPDISGGNLGVCLGTLNTRGQFAGVPATSASQCAGQGIAASGLAGKVNAIPAMNCYLNTMNGPPDGVTSGPLSFSRTACYGSNSAPPPSVCGNPTQLPLNVSGTYTVPPTVLPLAVGFSSPTGGCSLFATFDGSTPTCSSTAYSGTSSITSTTLIRVIACQAGFTPSSPAGGTWTININGVTPTLSGNLTVVVQ